MTVDRTNQENAEPKETAMNTYDNGFDGYEPTSEDLAAYQAISDSTPYTREHKIESYDLVEKLEARKDKRGDWVVYYYSAMALGMCEPVGRKKTKEEAVDFVNAYSGRIWKR